MSNTSDKNMEPAALLACFARPAFADGRPGDRVKFTIPNGIGRFGPEVKVVTGRVVMAFATHLVVNRGGRYGTPAVVNEQNLICVRPKISR